MTGKLLGRQKHDQSEVDRLRRQQSVALGRIRQGHQLERTVRVGFGKVVLVDLRNGLDVREGAPQHKEVHRQRAGRFRLQNQLIGDVTLARLMRITLAFVNYRLHNPLMVERGETGRFVVETMDVLIGTVWLHLEVIEDNFLVAQKIDQRVEEFLLLGRPGIVGLQGHHHLGTGLLRMSTVGFVCGNLVRRTAPLATDAGKLALSWSLFALIALMVLDRFVRELIAAVLALTGQFRNGLLDGQVARGSVLADLGTAVWTGRVLITQSAICQQMGETSGAHQMTHGTLVHCGPWQIQADGTAQDAPETSLQLFNHFSHRFVEFLSLDFRIILIRVFRFTFWGFPNLLRLIGTTSATTAATTAIA